MLQHNLLNIGHACFGNVFDDHRDDERVGFPLLIASFFSLLFPVRFKRCCCGFCLAFNNGVSFAFFDPVFSSADAMLQIV